VIERKNALPASDHYRLQADTSGEKASIADGRNGSWVIRPQALAA
jgi:hypothetical protein